MKTISIPGLALPVLLALAACGAEADRTGDGAANAAATANAAAPAAAPPAARSPLVLEGAGLGIPDASPPRIVSSTRPRPRPSKH